MTKSISETMKKEALELLQTGLFVRKVSKKLGISVGAVSAIKKKSHVDIPRNVGGAPCKISTSAARFVIRKFKTNECKSISDAQKALEKENIVVCGRTIRRMLNDADIRAKRKPKVLPLTPSRKKNRLLWAKEYRNWTADDWKKVVFSDETKINRLGSDGAQWFWNASNEEIREHHLQHMYKHGGGSVTLWGCFLWDGPGYIARINGTMDGKLYCNILEEDFKNSVNYYGYSVQNMVLQQDNDPKHTSKLAKAWFKDNNINVLDWPSYSPDLNPIENLWAIIKRRLCNYESAPKCTSELFDRVSREWNQITPDLCQELILSMPRRIEAVIKAKGGRTKY